MNSYALNYFLLEGPLALFAQTAWGGVHSDRGEDTQRVRQLFDRCRLLIEAVERARQRRVQRGGRLVVIESGFRDMRTCAWLDSIADEEAAREWLRSQAVLPFDTEPPTTRALEWFNREFPVHDLHA